MPITAFQYHVLQLLKAHRNPESYIAGGTAIQRDPDSLRFSQDIDIFHDADQAVTDSYQRDRAALIAAGFSINTHIAQPSFYRATVARDSEQVKMDWLRDTAFRFFPVLEDSELGYRLHDVDLTVNKCLALANRAEVRDALDILDLDRSVFSLAAAVTAACGKDPGFTPELMMDMIQRHITFTPDALASEALSRPVDPKQLKRDLTALIDRTSKILRGLGADEIGFVFVDQSGQVVKDLDSKQRATASLHSGSVRGSWPKIIQP